MSHTWIELDHAVLRDNLASLKNALRDRAGLVLVVKSNAYGHGLAETAACAVSAGVERFAVQSIEEALVVRSVAPCATVLIVSAIRPEDAPAARDADIVTALVSAEHAAELAARLQSCPGRPLRCHVKLDTGMGRLGFRWDETPAPVVQAASRPELAIEGVLTHFAAGNDNDRSLTRLQADRFRGAVEGIEAAGVALPFKHIANSRAVLCGDVWDMDGVRCGIVAYGYGHTVDLNAPGRGQQVCGPRGIRSRPFLQWKTRVLQVKRVPAGFGVSYGHTESTAQPTCLATVDAGYADGFFRALSSRGVMLVRGRRCRVIGRVTMNLTVLDTGPAGDVKAGDEVVILGEQGDASIWADEIAAQAGTIPYEILTSIRTGDRRVVRR